MKKNGFTFIEMLGVITLLSLIGLIVYMTVDKSLKDSKETLSATQIEAIKSAADLWRTDHIDLVPETGYYFISLGTLIDAGYIDEVIDAKGNEIYSRNMIISVGTGDILFDNEYIGLKYIQSTGTQYIDTGIIPTNDTGVMMKFSSQDIATDSIYFGSKGASNSRFWVGNASSKLYFGWNSDTSSSSRPAIGTDTIYEVKLNYLNDRKNVFNKQDVASSLASLSNNVYPITVFAGNSEGTISNKSRIKLYKFVITADDSIFYDFVPCQRKSDSAIGLLELYSGKFYSNSGTGQFIKGE